MKGCTSIVTSLATSTPAWIAMSRTVVSPALTKR